MQTTTSAPNRLQLLLCLLRLGERLGSHSQLGKQRALAKLVADFLQQKLTSQQLDQHHNLLSLVFWLARRPLESAYIPAVPQQDIRIGTCDGNINYTFQHMC